MCPGLWLNLRRAAWGFAATPRRRFATTSFTTPELLTSKKRLDVVVAEHCRVSRTAAKAAISEGRVLLNSVQAITSSTAVHAGAHIEVELAGDEASASSHDDGGESGSGGRAARSFAPSAVAVVGLGNNGEMFDGSRHNVGFAALDAIAASLGMGERQWSAAFGGQLATVSVVAQRGDGGQLATVSVVAQRGDERDVHLFKPHGFINSSGAPLLQLKRSLRLQGRDVMVVYDELALPLGRVRLRARGTNDALHNGIKSVIGHIGGSFVRLRIGVAPPHSPPPSSGIPKFVLGRFRPDKAPVRAAVLAESAAPAALDFARGVTADELVAKYNAVRLTAE